MAVMGSSARVVGVLGGMGPAATADFYRKLVEATPARRDQDHLRTLIWSDPSIPDRAEAFLRGGPSPVRGLLAGARLLEESGADFIAVPCNTAHLFLGAVRRRAGIPVLDMIGSTVDEILAAGSGAEPPPARSRCSEPRRRWRAGSTRIDSSTTVSPSSIRGTRSSARSSRRSPR
ncbi:aspartate/glutamate racemase family protein [Leucobacter sp. HNU]|uniref:aspartate/glutamate racemase family protein n=1 Tax=Leucobacter sp. HNU TaxID=3236805 RepID=UPI003A8020BE